MLIIKKKEKSKRKTISFPEGLSKRITQTATEYNTSFSKLVVEGCEYALNNIKKKGNLAEIEEDK